jgi:5-methylcytosine-specific restriction enzyme subunit McrC
MALRPDIVWKINGTPAAVIDAKYKAEKPASYPNADLYQLLAYCTVLGLQTGHLVYALGSEQPARHVIQRAGIEIVWHAVDLDCELVPLMDQMSRVAGQIASSAPVPSSAARMSSGASFAIFGG